MKPPPRLLICDHAPTRLGIRIALGDTVLVCAEADDANQAIRSAKREQPDVCLVGRETPGDGLAAVRGIRRAAPDAAIVVLAQVGDIDDLMEAIRSGAIGYVAGGVDADHLRRIIDAAAAAEAVIPRSMVSELVREVWGGGTGGESLTEREVQVLGMVRRGHTTATIAARLDIVPVTVRRHISAIVQKLGVEDRAELTRIAA